MEQQDGTKTILVARTSLLQFVLHLKSMEAVVFSATAAPKLQKAREAYIVVSYPTMTAFEMPEKQQNKTN